jgi:ubiquitin carboxyl-terminal hydrolase 5/13
MDAAFLESVRAAMSSVRKPGPHDTVCKDECVFCFDTPFSRDGLYVNLSTLRGVGADHLRLDRARTGNALYLHQKFTKRKKPKPTDGNERGVSEATETIPTEMAIGVEGGFAVDDAENAYETEETYALAFVSLRDDASDASDARSGSATSITIQSTPYPNQELPFIVCDAVDAIIAHAGFHSAAETTAWREEFKESKYARELKQEPASANTMISPDPTAWRCAESGADSNLWLNLGDGHIGSGRQHWDGSGGNGAALRHYQAMKKEGKEFPLVVKLGTITPSGADVYSYAPDEDDMVTDPLLAEHLAHWGINVMAMQKTEKSMAELQIDLNKGFEFDKITEAGAELERVSGASRVGLKNTGNTCYVNSVLQVLKEVPNIDARYRGNADVLFETAPADPTNDFPTQFAKLFAALNTDRYARDLENEDENLEIPEIAPRMFKQLVGKNHAEFSTGRQQDAVEYFQHLLEVMTRAEQNDVCKNDRLGTKAREREREEFVSSAKQFEFDVEEKVTCAVSGAVRYVRRRENVLPLEVPVDAATNAREIEAERERKRQRTARANEGATSSNEDEKNDAATDGVRPVVPFDACLAQFAADETVEDWFSTATGAKGAATRRSRFATFPEVLPVQVRRYYVASDWTPKKLDALVPMPETIDLGALRGVGLQPGETELPEMADTTAAAVPENPTDAPAVPAELESAFEPDPDIVAQLVGMGFSENGSRRAAGATRNAGAEPAMEWVFAHMEDPDFNDPYVPATGAALTGNSGAMPSPGADASAVAMLAAMGFAEKHAAAALERSGGDVERAADWLFSNADDLESAVAEAEAQSGRGAGGGAADASTISGGASLDASPCVDGPATYELFGVVSHMGGNTACGHYVAHVKSRGEWCIFNDERVARSREPPLDMGYLYFYRRAS